MTFIVFWILVVCIFDGTTSLDNCNKEFEFSSNKTLFSCQDYLLYRKDKPVNVLLKLIINRSFLYSKTPVFKAYFKVVENAPTVPDECECGSNRTIVGQKQPDLKYAIFVNESYFDAIIHSGSGQTFFWSGGIDAL